MTREQKKAIILEAFAAHGITDATVAEHGHTLDELAETFIDATNDIAALLAAQQ